MFAHRIGRLDEEYLLALLIARHEHKDRVGLVDAGEIVMRGTPIVVVTDLDNAWANLFVPEPMIPRVKLGQPARVITDAGGEGLHGKVTFISPKAEFTPRNVQTAEERSKLVYRIKVTVDNREGILKPGMPVDAELELP